MSIPFYFFIELTQARIRPAETRQRSVEIAIEQDEQAAIVWLTFISDAADI